MNAKQREAGKAALNDLERERRGSLTQVLATWTADDVAKRAAVSYFERTVPDALDALRRRLDSDKEVWDRWVSDADSLHRDMGDVLGYRSDWSMLSVLAATGKETASTVRSGALNVAAAAQSGTAWGLAAFAVAGFIAWRVLR